MRNTRRICAVMLLCGLPVAHGQTAVVSTGGNGTQAVSQAVSQAVIDGRVFQRLDANGDGRLTPEEARIDDAVAQAFERIDTDGDGIISRTEARRFDEKRAPADESVRETIKDGAAR